MSICALRESRFSLLISAHQTYLRHALRGLLLRRTHWT